MKAVHRNTYLSLLDKDPLSRVIKFSGNLHARAVSIQFYVASLVDINGTSFSCKDIQLMRSFDSYLCNQLGLTVCKQLLRRCCSYDLWKLQDLFDTSDAGSIIKYKPPSLLPRFHGKS